VRFELFVGVVEVALDSGILDSSVHALDLPVGPGMVGLGQSMFDPMKETEPVEGMATEARGWPLPVLRQIGELDAVVGEHGVDAIRNCFDERLEERGGGSHVGSLHEFNDGALRGAIDGYEQVEFALGGPHLSQVDVEEADRIGVELLLARRIALDLGQAAYAVTLQAPVQGRTGELRNRGLERIETVVERQQRVLAKSHDDGFLLDRQNRRPRNAWPRPAIHCGLPLLPLRNGLRVDAMTSGQRPHALLTMLYRSTDRLCRCGAPV